MLSSVHSSRLAARAGAGASRPVAVCRAAVETREAGSCACAAEAASTMAAKTKCVHPQRPISQACPDCPRRKGKSMTASAELHTCSAMQSMAAKTKCVHPTRPISQACPDCPRRKGKSMVEADGGSLLQTCSAVQTMAKAKCIHPTRPVSQACADCPRRR